MGPGSTRTHVVIAPIRPRASTSSAAHLAGEANWERRLYAGVRITFVPSEIRAALAAALGELGVEAEYFLALIQAFPGDPPYQHERGEAFLLRLEAACRRLISVGAALEVATQSYLSALETGFPELRAERDAETWWPLFGGYTLRGESIELRLRRCGFAYRHAVATHLASNIEAVAEHLALTLHALDTLPPAGVLPVASLQQGLYELASVMQGYIIPHHVTDMSEQAPGLLTSIGWLRALDTLEDTSLDSDITWAHTQYTYARHLATRAHQASPPGVSPKQTQAWAVTAMRDWQETISGLEQLRAAR